MRSTKYFHLDIVIRMLSAICQTQFAAKTMWSECPDDAGSNLSGALRSVLKLLWIKFDLLALIVYDQDLLFRCQDNVGNGV